MAAVDVRTDVEPMALEQASHLTAFARACKAAARTIALYPPEHPTVTAALDNVTSAAQIATATSALRLAILPDTITVEGRRMARQDASVSDLAALLHAHQVAMLTVEPLTDSDLWRRFLALVALAPDQARLRGGLGKLWATEGQTRIEIRSLDYRELLRGQLTGDRVTWDRIVAGCVDGHTEGFDQDTIDLLFGVLDDPAKMADLVDAVIARTEDADRAGASTEADGATGAGGAGTGGGGTGGGIGAGTGGGTGSPGGGRSALVIGGLLRAVAKYVEATQRDRLDQAMSAIAEAAGRLPVQTLQPIVRAGRDGSRGELARLVKDLAAHMTDGTLASMIATEIRGGRGTSRQLGDAFCGLAPDPDRRSAILTLARTKLAPEGAPASAPIEPALSQAWRESSDTLLAYSDEAFVSDSYNDELQHLASRAVDLDQDATDAPDVVASWRGTVNDACVRNLDAELIADLLQLQPDAASWRTMADLAMSRVNVLLVMGDFASAAFLVEAVRQHAIGHDDPAIRTAADEVIGGILHPTMMRHVASHLDTSDATILAAARRLCEALGTGIVDPLAEVLSREERARPRRNLIALLIGFGAAGRQAVERLRQSPNAAVRRTAVLLLREFGGHDALAELEAMLNDSEPHVQREATLAIAMLGIDQAYEALGRAVRRGSTRTKNAIMGVIWTLPDDDAQPVLAYLLQHAPLEGDLWSLHDRAIQRLASIGGHRSTLALAAVLERRVWWAPFKTAALHKLALTALARVDLPDAWRVIEVTGDRGPRGLRSTARALLAERPAAERTAS